MSNRHIVRLPLAAIAGVLLVSVLAVESSFAANPQPYRIVDTWNIGGEGFWDYLVVDSPVHRLYITHGSRVEVVDTQTGKSAGSISGLHGVHGVALDSAGKFGYLSDGQANAVVVFDRATLATVATIPVGTGPDAILFESATQTVWTFNGRGKSASVVDTATRKVVATVPLPGKPEFAVSDGKGTIFNNIEDKNEIVRIDVRSYKVTAEWPISGCESPSGLAIDKEGKRLFPVCDEKKMAVVDSNTGKVLANPAIGDGPDASVWDAAHKLVFASCGESGVLSVVNAGAPGYSTIENLPTEQGGRTMTYDPTTDRIYVVVGKMNRPSSAGGPPSGGGPSGGAPVGNPPSEAVAGIAQAASSAGESSFKVLVISR